MPHSLILRKHSTSPRLSRLATKIGEKCGLDAAGPPFVHRVMQRSFSFFPGLGAAVTLLVCACVGADHELEVDEFGAALSSAALERTSHQIGYDGSYRLIDYPGGDVPPAVGVCTDVLIRAYRSLGVDLQKRVHEDMLGHFSDYPQLWGLQRPDSNIDHRRVPNLQAYFRRHGLELPMSSDPVDYRTGDLVTWIVGQNLPHIGIVVDRRSPDGQRPMIVHNIGAGPKLEDILFAYPINGHYRYEIAGTLER